MKIKNTLQSCITYTLLVAFLVMTGFLLTKLGTGFDFTDNAFYVLWAAQPENVQASPHPFGFFTRVLWWLAGGRSTWFEALGLVALSLGAGYFSLSFSRFFHIDGVSRAWLLVLSLLSALIYYQFWLFAPSYNLLALLAVLLFFASGLDVFNPLAHRKVQIFAVLVLALSSLMAFYARPATFAALMAIALTWLFVFELKNRASWGWFFVSLLLVFGVSSWVFFGGISNFFNHLQTGFRLAHLLYERGSNVGILLDSFRQASHILQWSFDAWLKYWLVLLSVYGAVRWQGLKFNHRRLLQAAVLLLLIRLLWHSWGQRYYAYPFFEFYFSLLLLFLLDVWISRIKLENDPIELKLLLVLLVLAGAVFLPSLSTLNHLARHSSMSVVLLVVPSAFLLMHFDARNGVVYKSLFSLAVVLAVFSNSSRIYQDHYRLPEPVDQQTTPVVFLGGDTRSVDTPTALYINQLKTAALAAGWQQGAALVDLTGATPGALLVLDAKLVGNPWLIGGRSGSEAHAKAYLDLLGQEELKRAWVLTAPNGQRSIGRHVLWGGSPELTHTHEAIGELYFTARDEVQVLWRPKTAL